MTQRLSPIEYARLRRQMSDEFERLMWQMLRNRQRKGMKFRREQPLGIYTADFYCAAAKLVIEVDGSSHESANAKKYDDARDKWMEQQGIQVLRFSCADVEHEMDRLNGEIDAALEVHRCSEPLTPSPSPSRGEGSNGVSSHG